MFYRSRCIPETFTYIEKRLECIPSTFITEISLYFKLKTDLKCFRIQIAIKKAWILAEMNFAVLCVIFILKIS